MTRSKGKRRSCSMEPRLATTSQVLNGATHRMLMPSATTSHATSASSIPRESCRCVGTASHYVFLLFAVAWDASLKSTIMMSQTVETPRLVWRVEARKGQGNRVSERPARSVHVYVKVPDALQELGPWCCHRTFQLVCRPPPARVPCALLRFTPLPSVFSVTSKGVVRTARLDRQASLKSARVLATMPRDQAKGVADRVAAAFADPVLALPYLHSIQFGADLVELSAQVCAMLESEARCLSIPSPVYVLGDIHGNYTDLRFFTDNMWPMGMGLAPGNFLFLGDYVDRGQSSLECVAYLFAQKLLHPKKLFFIRGNHETLIANDIFCVHGGVPRPVGSERTLESIQKIPHTALLDVLDAKYYEENAQMSIVSDMLWGDPASEEKEPSMDSKGFGKSLRNGVAVSFGEKAIENFLQQHKFSRILCAHEVKMDGIAVSKSARVITIFSTSKDHGLREDAKCGCLLIDHGKISAINRSSQVTKNLQLQRRRSMSFQTEAHSGGAPMGSPLRAGQESNNSGIAGNASTEIGRPRSNFQGSTLSNVLSNAQDGDDGSAARAVRATSMEANANDGGSDSTDDEDDQLAPQPPR